jgi:hypothetical protein
MLLPSDFESLPPLPEFKDMLSMLRVLPLKGASFNQIQDICLKYFPFFPRMITNLHFQEANDKPFYRVRLNIDSKKEDLDLIRTYSYPSVNYCTENGRANMAGKTVFYCSNNVFAAIYESKPKIGDIGYLSIWENKIPRPLTTALYLPKKFANPNSWQSVANEAYLFAENYYDEHGKDKSEHFKLLNKFIADLFVTETSPYALTSFLSHVALYGDHPKDLILYPSIASDSYQCNFAIHPNIVERYLSFQKVIRFKIHEMDSSKFLRIGTGKENIGELTEQKFVWRDSTEQEKEFFNLASNG